MKNEISKLRNAFIKAATIKFNDVEKMVSEVETAIKNTNQYDYAVTIHEGSSTEIRLVRLDGDDFDGRDIPVIQSILKDANNNYFSSTQNAFKWFEVLTGSSGTYEPFFIKKTTNKTFPYLLLDKL